MENVEQGALWGDPVLERVVRGGHMASMLSLGVGRFLEVLDRPHTDDELQAAVDLLRDLYPSPGLMYDPTPYIEAQNWVYAKTMPENKHFYVVLRASTDWRAHMMFLRWIRLYGGDERFRSSWYRYMDVGEYHYWAMSSNDSIINRKELT
jgi:hypothetical protein